MKNTIKDVARHAGVSISTVSRVFNSTAFVDEATKSKVLASAKKLHYLPNQAARSLKQDLTHTIGLILPGFYGEYFSELMRGMDTAANSTEYDLLVTSFNSSDVRLKKAIQSMIGRVDGLIIMSPQMSSQQLEEVLPIHTPVVLLNASLDNSLYDIVNVNNFAGARAMVYHLAEHGHKKIAMIKGNDKSYDARQRTEGYRTALKEKKIDDYQFEIEGVFTKSSGYEAARKILSHKDPPTAIFAANDAMAIGALSALTELHIRVPDDIALAGFDDIPMAQYAHPQLTTVHFDLYKFGETAINRILQTINKGEEHTPEQIILDFEISVRDSCGNH